MKADSESKELGRKPHPRLTLGVGYLFRNLTDGAAFDVRIPGALGWLENQTIDRIIPGWFPESMHYHYNGIAMPVATETCP